MKINLCENTGMHCFFDYPTDGWLNQNHDALQGMGLGEINCSKATVIMRPKLFFRGPMAILKQSRMRRSEREAPKARWVYALHLLLPGPPATAIVREFHRFPDGRIVGPARGHRAPLKSGHSRCVRAECGR